MKSKVIVFSIILFTLFSCVSYARLGITMEENEKIYGKPVKIYERTDYVGYNVYGTPVIVLYENGIAIYESWRTGLNPGVKYGPWIEWYREKFEPETPKGKLGLHWIVFPLSARDHQPELESLPDPVNKYAYRYFKSADLEMWWHYPTCAWVDVLYEDSTQNFTGYYLVPEKDYGKKGAIRNMISIYEGEIRALIKVKGL